MKFIVALVCAGLLPVSAMAASTKPATAPAPAAAPAAATAEPTEPVDPSKAQINVTIDGIESDEGTIMVALCNKALSHDGCQFFEKTPAVVGSVTVNFVNITPGMWAVAAFQDKNDSGEMDTIMGIPKEPYGLSNDAASHMIPTLKDAQLKMQAGTNDIEMKIGSFMKK
jgi:uncharacterized protein (DUF2141 family)